MLRVPFDLEARRPYLIQAFSDAEYDRRAAVVCREMAAAGLDALLVFGNASAPSAVAYLTNYAPQFGSAFAVVRADGTMTVVTDSILHAEPMHSEIWMCRVADVRVALGPIYGGAVDQVAVLAADAVPPGARAGLAGGSILPYPLYAALAARLPDLRPADAALAAVRLSKSDEEVAKMREAGRIADAAMAAALGAIGPGVEETRAAAAAVERLRAMGATEAFGTCVVGGAQAGLKHGFPRRRAFNEGEMVFIDLGAALDGYMSDTSRCTVVGSGPGPGRASGSARDLLQIGLDLYHAGLQEMRAGRTVDDVSRALAATVRGTKFESDYCPGGFGHGIGTAVLEPPGLYAGNAFELRPRMTVAYEPMVVVTGLGTGVVEDTLLITETGYERLTTSPIVTWL
jgi:Xaa-Pro aminopeptidase